jgi:iron-sulfur cluster assembly accessory protein
VETVERITPVVSITEAAASKIRELQAEEPEGEAAVLRIAIQGGGCSGFEYALGFDTGVQEGDEANDFHGVTVVVDPLSAPYLKGASIDFVDTLQESGFKIENPNVAASCGCGHSFQPVEDDAAAVEGHTHSHAQHSHDQSGGCGSGGCGCSH